MRPPPEAARQATIDTAWQAIPRRLVDSRSLGPFAKHEKAPPTPPNAYATAFAASAPPMNKSYPEGSMMSAFMRDAATAYAVLALAPAP